MKGHCLCGEITVDAAVENAQVGVCHCDMCRRWGSSPFFAIHSTEPVQFHGLTPATYQSSEWAERGFCPNCGSSLYYRLLGSEDYILSAGLFDGEFTLHEQIFIDEKPAYYDLANDTPKLTAKEVFEKYAPKE